MKSFDRLAADNPKVGTTWGYVTEGPFTIDVCEPVERFWWWKLHRRQSPVSVLVAAGFDEDVAVTWQQACAALDEAIDSEKAER